jgi:preprotein translocase subunit YajC
VLLNFYLLTQGASSQTSSPALGFLPIVLIFGIFYLLLFMPMQKQRKRQKQMLLELQNGATVLTTGGIVGTIVAMEDDMLVLRVKPDNIKLQVARSAVSSLISGDAQKK